MNIYKVKANLLYRPVYVMNIILLRHINSPQKKILTTPNVDLARIKICLTTPM